MEENKGMFMEINEETNPFVNVTWLDNGMVMATIGCLPEDVNKIKELLEFVEKLDIDI